MLGPTRFREMKDIRDYATSRVGTGFTPHLERRIVLALNDAIHEIEELRTKYDEITFLHRLMCKVARERYEEINDLRKRLGEDPIPSHYEEG